MIKTYMRSECLIDCVDSIEKYLAPETYRLYIADDGPIDEVKLNLYERIEREEHIVLRLPRNIGNPVGKNALIPHIQEKFVLYLDDDMQLCSETNIENMISILNHDTSIGLVCDRERQLFEGKGAKAGEIREFLFCNFRRVGPTLFLDPISPKENDYEQINGIRYHFCEYGRNSYLIKREMLEEVQWEDELYINQEHLAFYLKLEAHPFWKAVFTPDSTHLHGGLPMNQLSQEYIYQRYYSDNPWPVLYCKYGVYQVSGLKLGIKGWLLFVKRTLEGYYYLLRHLLFGKIRES